MIKIYTFSKYHILITLLIQDILSFKIQKHNKFCILLIQYQKLTYNSFYLEKIKSYIRI